MRPGVPERSRCVSPDERAPPGQPAVRRRSGARDRDGDLRRAHHRTGRDGRRADGVGLRRWARRRGRAPARDRRHRWYNLRPRGRHLLDRRRARRGPLHARRDRARDARRRRDRSRVPARGRDGRRRIGPGSPRASASRCLSHWLSRPGGAGRPHARLGGLREPTGAPDRLRRRGHALDGR